MSDLRISGAAGAPRPDPDELRLRKVAQQMEGVFVEQLFRAMRETVPQQGMLDGGSGEEMFRGMLDEHLAALAPQRWDHGLGAALYRQLRGAQPAPPSAPPLSGDQGGTR